MAKKTKPRWGEHGVSEVPDFDLSDRQARDAAAKLGKTRPADIARLEAELNEIGRQYLRWTAQDEKGPTRADTAMLRLKKCLRPANVWSCSSKPWTTPPRLI